MFFKFFFVCYTSENNLNNISLHYDLMLFLKRMLTNFLQQDNFLPSAIINKIIWFLHLKLCFDLYASLIFSVLYDTNKILRAIVLLFNSKFFQSFCSDGKSISFQLYWSIKGLILDILWGSFLMFWQFNATVKAYWKQLSLFLG